MRTSRFTQLSWAAAMALSLAACGGSSDNASPGSIVVEVPVEGSNNGGSNGGSNGGNNGGSSGGNNGGNTPTVATVIPADVQSTGAFTETNQQIGGKTVMEIDSSKLSNGLSGVTLGNDFVFVLKGGTPLRVSN